MLRLQGRDGAPPVEVVPAALEARMEALHARTHPAVILTLPVDITTDTVTDIQPLALAGAVQHEAQVQEETEHLESTLGAQVRDAQLQHDEADGIHVKAVRLVLVP